MGNVTTDAPVLTVTSALAPSATNTYSLYAIDGYTGQDSQIWINSASPTTPFPNGSEVLIASVASPHTSFNGTWTVLSSFAYGFNWVLTINYILGTNLGVLVGAGTATTVNPPNLKLLLTTSPKSGVLKATFACGSTTVTTTVSVIPVGAMKFGPSVQGGENTVTSGVGPVFVRRQANYLSDAQYRRWASVVYNKQIFFTNDLNPITFTDGACVRTYSNRQPAARYIDVFFDHLVVGYPTWNGNPTPTRVHWSDLYRINQWVPSPKNEADFFDVEEWCRTDFPLCGCTGLGRIGNTLWVYTPSAIVSVRYQGRMKSPVFGQGLTGSTAGGGGPVMIFGDRVLKDIGNSLMYGLIVYKDMHYFWDGVEQDFYKFNGQEVESIGIKIKQYFLSNVNQSWSLFQATWGYARPGRQEIVWVFVSNKQSGLYFDQAIVYNWKTGRWYTQSVENLHCFVGPGITGGRADDLVGETSALTGTADQLLVPTTVNPPLWGGGLVNNLFRESTEADPDSALLYQDTPSLTTKDYGYDDLEHIKEASSIVIHAMDRYSNGVNVALSVRDNLDDPVTFPTTKLYKYDPEEKRVGLPRNAGRLLRYRFQPATTNGPVRDFVWGGFVDNVKRRVTDV